MNKLLLALENQKNFSYMTHLSKSTILLKESPMITTYQEKALNSWPVWPCKVGKTRPRFKRYIFQILCLVKS